MPASRWPVLCPISVPPTRLCLPLISRTSHKTTPARNRARLMVKVREPVAFSAKTAPFRIFRQASREKIWLMKMRKFLIVWLVKIAVLLAALGWAGCESTRHADMKQMLSASGFTNVAPADGPPCLLSLRLCAELRLTSRLRQAEKHISRWGIDDDEIVRAVVAGRFRWGDPIRAMQVAVLLQIPPDRGIRPEYQCGVGMGQ